VEYNWTGFNIKLLVAGALLFCIGVILVESKESRHSFCTRHKKLYLASGAPSGICRCTNCRPTWYGRSELCYYWLTQNRRCIWLVSVVPAHSIKSCIRQAVRQVVFTDVLIVGQLFFCIFFWRARVCQPLLRLCRPFMIFKGCLDSNPEYCRSKLARYRLSHPSLCLATHPSP
jgi:hypothetical protein